jgi:hypothetical protein
MKQRRMYSVSPSNTTNTPKRMSYGIASPFIFSEETTSTCPLWWSTPPSSRGRMSEGISSIAPGG